MPIILLIIAGAAAVAAGFLAVSVSPSVLMAAAGCLLVSAFAFMSPKLSLVLLIFSMLLSPEIGFGGGFGSRSAVLRYDDILLVIIFFAWLARTAISKSKPFITATPVQTPMLIYTAIAIVSTALGVLRGDVRFQIAFFYVLKYVEYFLLYFMVVNILDSKEEMKRYLKYAFVVALLVTAYAYYFYASAGPFARATAPFETTIDKPGESEPASLGGYYLLVFGFIMAAMTEYSGSALFYGLAAMLAMLPAFLATFSRSSYIGFVFMSLTLLVTARRRRMVLGFFLCVGAASAFLIPGLLKKVENRVTMTYRGPEAVNVYKLGSAGQIRMEGSAAARVDSLHRVLFEKLPRHPLLGWGVTGIGLGDTQYALVLGEMGLAGFFVFLWMLYRIIRTAGSVYRAYEEPWIKALGLGLMASIAGLLFQAVGVNNFIIVRIMEPFWFLTAMVMALNNGLDKKTAASG